MYTALSALEELQDKNVMADIGFFGTFISVNVSWGLCTAKVLLSCSADDISFGSYFKAAFGFGVREFLI